MNYPSPLVRHIDGSGGLGDPDLHIFGLVFPVPNLRSTNNKYVNADIADYCYGQPLGPRNL